MSVLERVLALLHRRSDEAKLTATVRGRPGAPGRTAPGVSQKMGNVIVARVITVMVAVAVALGISLVVTPAASADDSSFTVGAVTNNCGIATCSTYISRSGTESLDRFLDNKVAYYGSWAGGAIVCGALGAVPYIGVPLGTYCGFRFAQFDQVLDEAADKDKCFKVTYLPTGHVTHISTNNGQYCKN